MSGSPYSNGVYKTIDDDSNWTEITPIEDFLSHNYGLTLFNEDNGYTGGS